MKKYLTATLFVVALSALLAGPAPAQEEGEPTAGTAEAPGKTIKIVTGGDEPICGPEGLEPGPGKTIIREEVLLPVFGMLVPVTFFAGIAVVIIVAILMGHRTAKMRYEIIQLAIKEGKEIPLDLLRNGHRRRDPLLSGLILTGLGIAVSISVGAVSGWIQAVWGLIPMAIGIAFLIYVPFYRKQKKEDENR